MKAAVTIAISLAARSAFGAQLTVITDPPQAEVFVGPTQVGTTDTRGRLILELPAGRHTVILTIKKTGYVQAERRLNVGDDTNLVVRINLSPLQAPTAPGPMTPASVRVGDAGAAVVARPRGDAQVLEVVAAGTVMEVTGYSTGEVGNWYSVLLPPKDGVQRQGFVGALLVQPLRGGMSGPVRTAPSPAPLPPPAPPHPEPSSSTIVSAENRPRKRSYTGHGRTELALDGTLNVLSAEGESVYFLSANVGYGYFAADDLEVGVGVGLQKAEGVDTSGSVAGFLRFHFSGGREQRIVPLVGVALGVGFAGGQSGLALGLGAGVKGFVGNGDAAILFGVGYTRIEIEGIGFNSVGFAVGVSAFF